MALDTLNVDATLPGVQQVAADSVSWLGLRGLWLS